ncbi:MAG: S-layer homology domain-containing protein [Nitriliruptorales bacterium]
MFGTRKLSATVGVALVVATLPLGRATGDRPTDAWDAREPRAASPAGDAPARPASSDEIRDPRAAVGAGRFSDDDRSAHQGYIEAIAGAGITTGCNPPTNDRFCPADPITRGQMAAFLVRALDLPDAPPAGFADVPPGTLYDDEINAVAAAGITSGCGPNRFCPFEAVTRAQMAGLLVAAFDLEDGAGSDRFRDDDSSVLEDQIDRLATAGITGGCDGSGVRYCPQARVPREQMATFLGRALGLEPVDVEPPPQPAPAPNVETSQDPSEDPHGLVHRPASGRTYTLGTDQWQVWVCEVPKNTSDAYYSGFSARASVDPGRTASLLNEHVAAYYAWASDGAYKPVFNAGGRFKVGNAVIDVRAACEAGGEERAAGAEAVLVVENVTHANGYGGPGYQCSQRDCVPATALPQNGRSATVGACAVITCSGWGAPVVATVVHEVGHTLSFPHSYAAEGGGSRYDEYDNPSDMMSGHVHTVVDGVRMPLGTVAFNQYAAGWMPAGRAAVHGGGTREYRMGPFGTAATQLVVVPSSDPQAFTALDVRTRRAYDKGLVREGVSVHRIDQRVGACAGGYHDGCGGIERRQRQLPARGGSWDHVIQVGDSIDLGGVRLSVLARDGAAFTIRLSGSEAAFGVTPASGVSGSSTPS